MSLLSLQRLLKWKFW